MPQLILMYSWFAIFYLLPAMISGQNPAKSLPGPSNNIRQYLITEAGEITAKSLSGIHSLTQWEVVRSEKKRQLAEMLGLNSYPFFANRTPVVVTYVDTIQQDGFSIVKLYYESMDDLYVPANLYIPDNLSEPAPAILYVCGHAHNQKSHYQAHARNFAKNGFVTLLIETIQRGEVKGVHLGPYERGWFHWYSRGYNPAGVEVWNGLRGIDFLQELQIVDASKIGVTGISGGGSQSWYLAALDDRIQATAAVAGAGSLEGQVCNRTIDDHCDCMMPINTYRWDFTDIGALIAPRPFLIAQTRHDGYYSIESVRELYHRVGKIYQMYNQPENISMIEAPGGHSYGDHDQMRPQILSYFLEKLQGIAKSIDEPLRVDISEVLSEEALQVYTDGPPQRDRTRTIQESFIPLSEIPQTSTEKELEDYRDDVMAFLAAKTFGAFPKNPVPLEIHKGFTTRDFSRFGRETYSFIPEAGWRLKVQIRRTAFPDTVEAPLLLVLNSPDGNPQDFQRTIAGIRQDINVAWFDARGIGETAWEDDLNWHVRRSAAWSGRTLASMRVYDVLRCLETLRETQGIDPDRIHILAEKEMAVVAAYAALLDGNISGLIFKDPPASQNLPDFADENNPVNATAASDKAGVEMLNCLQITDFAQVVGLHYPNRVTLMGEVPESFRWVEKLYSDLGKADQFHVTVLLNENLLER